MGVGVIVWGIFLHVIFFIIFGIFCNFFQTSRTLGGAPGALGYLGGVLGGCVRSPGGPPIKVGGEQGEVKNHSHNPPQYVFMTKT